MHAPTVPSPSKAAVAFFCVMSGIFWLAFAVSVGLTVVAFLNRHDGHGFAGIFVVIVGFCDLVTFVVAYLFTLSASWRVRALRQTPSSAAHGDAS